MKTKNNDNVKMLKAALCISAFCLSVTFVASAHSMEEYRADEECKALCVDILNDCGEYGLMNDSITHVYDTLRTHKNTPLERYVRLVSECAENAEFLDVVGGTDAWEEFCERVVLSEEYREYF